MLGRSLASPHSPSARTQFAAGDAVGAVGPVEEHSCCRIEEVAGCSSWAAVVHTAAAVHIAVHIAVAPDGTIVVAAEARQSSSPLLRLDATLRR